MLDTANVIKCCSIGMMPVDLHNRFSVCTVGEVCTWGWNCGIWRRQFYCGWCDLALYWVCELITFPDISIIFCFVVSWDVYSFKQEMLTDEDCTCRPNFLLAWRVKDLNCINLCLLQVLLLLPIFGYKGPGDSWQQSRTPIWACVSTNIGPITFFCGSSAKGEPLISPTYAWSRLHFFYASVGWQIA